MKYWNEMNNKYGFEDGESVSSFAEIADWIEKNVSEEVSNEA